MKRSTGKLLSRGMDTDLSVVERNRLEAILARDPEAARLHAAWQNAGHLLRADAARISSPDPLLAWHDIRREIRQRRVTPAPSFGALLAGRFRWAGAMAALLMLGIMAWSTIRVARTPEALTASLNDATAPSQVEWVVAEVPGATTMIFTDTENDMTVIWMDLAQNSEPHDS